MIKTLRDILSRHFISTMKAELEQLEGEYVDPVPNLPQFRDSVRLRPLIESPRGKKSWFCGNPSLPLDFEIPEIDGEKVSFVAQINCSDLPRNLWGGAGPRTGWLVFFLTSDGPLKAFVTHTKSLGEEREMTPQKPDKWMRNTVNNRSTGAAWRIEVIHHQQGQEDIKSKFVEGSDPQNPKPASVDECFLRLGPLRPVDWPTALALLAAFVQKMDKGTNDIDAKEKSLKSRLAPREPTDDIERLEAIKKEQEAAQYELNLIDEQRELAKSHIKQMKAIYLHALERSKSGVFSRVVWAELDQLICDGDWKMLKIESITHQEGRVEFSHKLTSFEPFNYKTSHRYWSEYFNLHEFTAHRIFATDPDDLLPDVRKYYEAIWNYQAFHAVGQMGGTPDGFIETTDFRPINFASPVEKERQLALGPIYSNLRPHEPPFHEENWVLLQLPSSRLMNWAWGDLYEIVLRIPAKNLAKGDFSVIKLDITN